MEDKVVELLKKLKMNKSYSFEKIAEKLEITDKEELKELKSILDKKVDENVILLTPSNTYKHMAKTSYRRGVFHANRSGGGKVLVVTSYEKDGEQVVLQKEYTVRAEDANGAINNDEVLIDINLRDSEDVKAKVFRVIDRNLNNVYGRIETLGSGTYVVPIDKSLKNLKIAVEGEYLEGQLVEVRLDRQTSSNFYLGTVVRTGDFKDDPKEDILMEAFVNGIDDKFSEASLIQKDKLPDKVLPTDFIGRQDLRGNETVTIDGIDTNDIDDAAGLRVLPNGHFELIVSIADVDHYVPFNSPLDLDARRKGNSNYLAGTVIPMLHRKLSNGICSLNPKVDRCAMSVRMEIDQEGNVVRKDIFPSVIRSDLKMDYKTVNNILYNKYNEDDFPPEYKEHEEMLKQMYKLSLILRKKRIKNGAVEFNRPELKVILDENGKPIRIEKRVQDIAENLIEELMIVTNVSVATLLNDLGIPVDFRVHDTPNLDRLSEFFRLLETIGYPYSKYSPEKCSNDPKALQDLVDFINKDCPENLRTMLNTNLVKCMSRAKYSPVNIGHSGLAEKFYVHFTSPIRRYADLTLHRIIKECFFDRKNASKNIKKWKRLLPEICYHISNREVIADKTERTVDDMKCAEYMKERVSENYVGTIIEISNTGFVVQLDNLIEGKVRIKDLPGKYSYNQDTFSLLSMNGNEDYFIGDQVLVSVKGANKERKTIDFKVLEKLNDNSNKFVKRENELVKVKKKQKDIARQERKRRYLEKKG